jgi:ribosomal protein L16 Arg81 hydroxylase
MATASTSSNPAIERCTGDPAAFVRDHWAKAPLLRRGAGPGGFDDLLSLDDVDRILSTTSPRTTTSSSSSSRRRSTNGS